MSTRAALAHTWQAAWIRGVTRDVSNSAEQGALRTCVEEEPLSGSSRPSRTLGMSRVMPYWLLGHANELKVRTRSTVTARVSAPDALGLLRARDQLPHTDNRCCDHSHIVSETDRTGDQLRNKIDW